ncbi:MAG: ABC transporter ATP-binding protein [Candidatus Eremiobacterota bacterium]
MAGAHTPITGPRPPLVDPPIVAQGLTVVFGGRAVLKNITFEVRKGETLAVMGLSGVGKSTLLRCLIGLEKPTSGHIAMNGRDIADLRPREWDELRMRVGMVFQMPALFDSLTVGENVAFGLREHTRLREEEIVRVVSEKLAIVDLEGVEHLYPNQLSGGMQKRASLARTIATDPDILLYDEPTTGLDPIITTVISELIRDVQQRMSATSIVVTHDVRGALMVAQKIAMLHEGQIVWIGSALDFQSTDNPYVVQFRDGRVAGPIQV